MHHFGSWNKVLNIASYVDDTLACGESSFSQLTEEARTSLEANSREYDSIRFSVVYIDLSDNGFNIHQRLYVDRQNPLLSDAKFVLWQQYRAQLSWLIHSLSDASVVASKLAQVIEKLFNISIVNKYNTTVRYLQNTLHLSFRKCKLDPESLHVRACTDALLPTNPGHSSPLGYIVLLADKHDNACVLQYASLMS